MILKLETLLYQNIFITFHHIVYTESDSDSKKKKWFSILKNMSNKYILVIVENMANSQDANEIDFESFL